MTEHLPNWDKLNQLLVPLAQIGEEPGNVAAILRHIASVALKVFDAHATILYAINPITRRSVEPPSIVGDVSLEEADLYKHITQEEFLKYLLDKRRVVITNLEDVRTHHLTHMYLKGFRSCAVLALYTEQRQKLLGTLVLGFRQPQHFNETHHQLFEVFIEQASSLLQRAWLFSRYQKVATIGQEINHDLTDTQALFRKLRERIPSVLDSSHALLLAVYLPQSHTFDLLLEDEGNPVLESDVVLNGACSYTIHKQKPLFIGHLSEERDTLPCQIIPVEGSTPKEAFIFVPLLFRGKSLGALSIQHPQPHAYTRIDQTILELLANHIALAIYNIYLFDSLDRLTDSGQILTQHLDTEQTLQTVVDQIRSVTKADSVILYPHEITHQQLLRPRIAGTLANSTIQTMYTSRSDDIASLMFDYGQPIFARESTTLYHRLLGNNQPRSNHFVERERLRSTAAIPLRIREMTVGVLFVNFCQSQRFDGFQQLLIESLAHYAAIAINNAQAFKELSQRRVHELKILQRIDIKSTLNLQSVLDTILSKAREQVTASQASILLHNPQLQLLEIVAASGPQAEAIKGMKYSLQETKGIVRWVLREKKPARVDNVHADIPWRDLYISIDEAVQSELDVPLLDGDTVVGVISFESTRLRAFSQEDEDFLITLSNHAVLAIKNAQLYEQALKEAKRFDLLYQAGQELGKITELARVPILPGETDGKLVRQSPKVCEGTSCDLLPFPPKDGDPLAQAEQAYDITLRIAEQYNGCIVIIRAYEDASKELVAVRASPQCALPLERIKINEGVNGQVAREGQTIVIHDTQDPPAGVVQLKFPDPLLRSIIVTPVLFKDRYYGNLELCHQEVDYFRDSDDQLFLESLAHQLAITLYRLETVQARRESEKRALSAEVMGSLAQVSYELAHRAGNDLGLTGAYIDDIREELEETGGVSPLIAEKLDKIARAAQRVLELANNIKQPLGESGKAIVIAPAILLEEVYTHIVASLPPHTQIGLHIEDDVRPIEVVYNQVINILHNLVANAREAMPTGGKILLKACNHGGHVALQVIDTGDGIPPELLPKIFELSFSTKGSSGFGLWSARTYTIKNNGILLVDSQVGEGTTFTLLLPAVLDSKRLEHV